MIWPDKYTIPQVDRHSLKIDDKHIVDFYPAPHAIDLYFTSKEQEEHTYPDIIDVTCGAYITVYQRYHLMVDSTTKHPYAFTAGYHYIEVESGDF